MEVLLKSNSCFYEVNERYKRFTADERGRLAYQARSMFLHDRASEMAAAIKEGKLEKARETAKILKEKGISLDLIREATGLSREEVEKL